MTGMMPPDLQGDAPMEAQNAFDRAFFDQIAAWHAGGEPEALIAVMAKVQFEDFAVERSTPNAVDAHIKLLWGPEDGQMIYLAVGQALGLDAVKEMDLWARGKLRERGKKLGYGSDHVWLFSQPGPNGDDGHG